MMPLTLLLNWRVWAAVGLALAMAASHWFAYHQGGLSATVALDAYIISQKTAHIAALEEARTKEQSLQLANTKVQNDYQTLKQKSARASAGAQSERLLLLAALDAARAAPTDTFPSGRVDASPAERVLAESVGRYEEVARDADRLSDQVTGLQGYVRNVCVK
tara:strand:+ start:7877 stop:8362 length:486 start_codon:yes stop_codon:yes gene_type:complete